MKIRLHDFVTKTFCVFPPLLQFLVYSPGFVQCFFPNNTRWLQQTKITFSKKLFVAARQWLFRRFKHFNFHFYHVCVSSSVLSSSISGISTCVSSEPPLPSPWPHLPSSTQQPFTPPLPSPQGPHNFLLGRGHIAVFTKIFARLDSWRQDSLETRLLCQLQEKKPIVENASFYKSLNRPFDKKVGVEFGQLSWFRFAAVFLH